MFPKVRQTRFKRVSDFYSLAVLVQKFEREGLILTDRKRNKLAWDLLVVFSNGVDEVGQLQKQARVILLLPEIDEGSRRLTERRCV